MSSKKAWMESVGVTKAAVRYHTNWQYIYRWMKRYDGTLHSLEDRSHLPHRHPNQHTPEKIKLILNMRHRNTNAGIKVERSHRKGNEEFYATHRFFSFVDFKL